MLGRRWCIVGRDEVNRGAEPPFLDADVHHAPVVLAVPYICWSRGVRPPPNKADGQRPAASHLIPNTVEGPLLASP